MSYSPHVPWDGPKIDLHLRMIDGVVCLFDQDGRMVSGVVGLVAEYPGLDDVTRVTVTLFPVRPPADGGG